MGFRIKHGSFTLLKRMKRKNKKFNNFITHLRYHYQLG